MGLLDKMFEFMKVTDINTPLPRAQAAPKPQFNLFAPPPRPRPNPQVGPDTPAADAKAVATAPPASTGAPTTTTPNANQTNTPAPSPQQTNPTVNPQGLSTRQILGNEAADSMGVGQENLGPVTQNLINTVNTLGGQAAQGQTPEGQPAQTTTSGAVTPVPPSNIQNAAGTPPYRQPNTETLTVDGQTFTATRQTDNRTIRYYDQNGQEVADPQLRSQLARAYGTALYARENVSTDPGVRTVSLPKVDATGQPMTDANNQPVRQTWEMRMKDGVLQIRERGSGDDKWDTPDKYNLELTPLSFVQNDLKNVRDVPINGQAYKVGEFNGNTIIFDTNGNQVNPDNLPGGRTGTVARALLQQPATMERVFRGVTGMQSGTANLNPAELGVAIGPDGNPVSISTVVRENNGRYELISRTYVGPDGVTRLLSEQEALNTSAKGGMLSLGMYSSREEAEAAANKLKTDFESGANNVVQQLRFEEARNAVNGAVRPGERTYDFGKQKVVYRNGTFRDASDPTKIVSAAGDDQELVRRAQNDMRLAAAVSPLQRRQIESEIATEEYNRRLNFTPGKEKRGFWQTLRGMGVGALQGFLSGGLGGAIGGAVTGGVLGTINPNYDDLAINQMFKLPQAKAKMEAAQANYKTAQENAGKMFDLQKDAAALAKTQAETLGLEIGLFEKIRANSNRWKQIERQGFADEGDIIAFEAEMTTLLRDAGLLQPGQTFQSFLSPFSGGKWVSAGTADDGTPLFRNENNNVLVPGRLLNSNVPFRFVSQAQNQSTVQIGDATFTLYGTAKQVSDQLVEISKWYETGKMNRDEALARMQIDVAKQNADALNARTTAIANLQAEVAKQSATSGGAGTVATEINKKIEEQQKAVAAARDAVNKAARPDPKQIEAYNDALKRLYELQNQYYKHLETNLSAFGASENLRTLLNGLPKVTLIQAPTLSNVPDVRFSSPRAVNPATANSGRGAPGVNYGEPTRRDSDVEGVIGTNMVNPVRPRGGRANRNSQMSA